MEALGWWLMLVGSLRLASVWFGFFDIWALRLAVFSNTTSMLPLRSLFFGCLILYLNYYFLYYNVTELSNIPFCVLNGNLITLAVSVFLLYLYMYFPPKTAICFPLIVHLLFVLIDMQCLKFMGGRLEFGRF
ncbi:hypothetical protein Godav_009143 [Gossypium davidsonii]|uniref:Uncharacterized protein n=1 Tax=Gossypium davidsonii TaxID=34287 RepID=A0A7J8SC59_GOSDV|nr:hypothetical protein [Gossypium davidsonii]